MDQGWVLLCQFIGTIAGAWIGAYIYGKRTKTGRQEALKKYAQEVIQQALDSAHAQERGKRLATHEDIENVLNELQSVTKLTESIKHQFSREEWDRQELVKQRRLLYGDAFRVVAKLRHTAQELHFQAGRLPIDKRPLYLLDGLRAFTDLFVDLEATRNLSMVYLRAEAHAAFNLERPDEGDPYLLIGSWVKMFEQMQSGLIAAAKLDLFATDLPA